MFLDRPGVPKKDFLSYKFQLRLAEPLTYSGWASYIRKYKLLRARVVHFADLSEREHLLAELPPFYWRELAEAEAAKDRVRSVVKVTCQDPVRIGQQIVRQMAWPSLGRPLKMVAKRNCVRIHCGSVDQAAYARKVYCVAHLVGGHAPIRLQQVVHRWIADCMIAWVTSKLQNEVKQGVLTTNRGVAPARVPTNASSDDKEDNMTFRKGVNPQARTCPVEPWSKGCPRRTGKSGLPPVEFPDSTSLCTSTPEDLVVTPAKKVLGQSCPPERFEPRP